MSRIFVNLYVPAHVTCSQDSVRCGLGIITSTLRRVIRLELELPAVVRFSLRLRIPHWLRMLRYTSTANANPRLAPGTFAALQRDWSPEIEWNWCCRCRHGFCRLTPTIQ